jgi:hypothetical protein
VLNITRQAGIQLVGYSNEAQRGIDDVTINNNTVISSGDSGAFLWLIGDPAHNIVPEASNVTVVNNVLIARNVTGGQSGGVFTYDADMSSFSLISNNIWSIPQSFAEKANYAWSYWHTSSGDLNATEWEALGVVVNDQVTTTAILTGGSYQLSLGGVTAGSQLAAAA